VVSTGAKQSLANIALVSLNPGDEVILPCPYWVSYSDIVKIAEGIPVEVKTSIADDYKMTPEQLEAAITPKTKMLWYSSPCNPSGSIYSKEELRALADVLQKHPQIIVVSDEIYEHINYGTNCIAQRAVITALQAPVSNVQYMIDAFRNRRTLILDLLNTIEGFVCNEPEGAFYVFPDISYFFGKTLNGVLIKDASDFSMYLLEQAGVATVTGVAFGNDNSIRISYAASTDDIKEAVNRIKKAVSS